VARFLGHLIHEGPPRLLTGKTRRLFQPPSDAFDELLVVGTKLTQLALSTFRLVVPALELALPLRQGLEALRDRFFLLGDATLRGRELAALLLGLALRVVLGAQYDFLRVQL